MRDERCVFRCESAQGNGIDEWIEVERRQVGIVGTDVHFFDEWQGERWTEHDKEL